MTSGTYLNPKQKTVNLLTNQQQGEQEIVLL